MIETNIVAVRARLLLRHELHDSGALLWIVECRDIAARLVEHVIALLLGAVEQLAVDADMILERIVARAERVDDDTVDLHAAFEDDLLSFAAAGDACLRKNLLEAVAFGFVFSVGLCCGGGLRHSVSGFLTAELLIAVVRFLSIIACFRLIHAFATINGSDT